MVKKQQEPSKFVPDPELVTIMQGRITAYRDGELRAQEWMLHDKKLRVEAEERLKKYLESGIVE